MLRTNLDFAMLENDGAAHDPGHERDRAGGEVDDRGEPRHRRGTRRPACRARRSRPADPLPRPLLQSHARPGHHRCRPREHRARERPTADRSRHRPGSAPTATKNGRTNGHARRPGCPRRARRRAHGLPTRESSWAAGASARSFARLHDSYDLVIIDTPPILRVGDAMTLSAHVDGILIITKLTLARRPTLAELRRVLATSPTKSLGYVVTGPRDGQAWDTAMDTTTAATASRNRRRRSSPLIRARRRRRMCPGSALARATSTPESESQ